MSPKIDFENQFAISKTSLIEFCNQYNLPNLLSFEQSSSGIAHQTIFLSFVDGAEAVLKVYRQHYKDVDEIQNEIEFVDYLHQNGIPVVQFIRNKTAKIPTKINLNNKEWIGVLMKKGKGYHAKGFQITENLKLLENTALIHAKMHLLGIQYWQDQNFTPELVLNPLQNGIGLTLTELKTEMNEDLLSNLDPETKLLVEKILQFDFKYVTTLPSGFIHGDFDNTNFLAEDNQVSCILDFDDLRPEPVVSCLAVILTELVWIDPSLIAYKYYLDKYQTIRPLKKQELEYLQLAMQMVVYFFLLWSIKNKEDQKTLRSYLQLAKTLEIIHY